MAHEQPVNQCHLLGILMRICSEHTVKMNVCRVFAVLHSVLGGLFSVKRKGCPPFLGKYEKDAHHFWRSLLFQDKPLSLSLYIYTHTRSDTRMYTQPQAKMRQGLHLFCHRLKGQDISLPGGGRRAGFTRVCIYIYIYMYGTPFAWIYLPSDLVCAAFSALRALGKATKERAHVQKQI